MGTNSRHDGQAYERPGRLLEDARRKRGLSLREAARRTGISAGLLETLEKEDAALLPEGDELYARVQLRVYARFLGLDDRALSRRWDPKRSIGEPDVREPEAREPEVRDERRPVPDGEPESQTVPLMVEARGVRKSYKAEELVVQALKGVDLRVEKGALVAVMGPSGCGKTTLLNVLSGLDDIDGGEIFVAGEPLHEMDDARRTAHRARHMGFVFQGFNLLPVLSAVENVELPLLVGGARVKAARKRALAVLEQVGLAHRAEHRPGQLSGGQQQRVAIARALANEPAIVWADEPTGNLDSDTSEEVLELLLELNRENGQTFVVVTHDEGVGARMDRTVRMSDGRVVAQNESPEAPGA